MSCLARPALGRLGERLAGEHLERLGYRILDANHRTRDGELDLVALDGDVLVFVEVKTRRAGSGWALEAVGPRKRRQVRRLAAHWLAQPLARPAGREIRFDAVGVTVDAHGRLVALEHIQEAF